MSTPVPAIRDHELQLVVARKQIVADGVVRLTLRDRGGAALPAWEPGAHIDLALGDGLIRQYSLCGDPNHMTEFEVAVLREAGSRGGSKYVHDTLAEGEVIRVQGPRNHFQLVDAQEYVFIAGGIGITPIIPMIRSVASRDAKWRLIYGGRSRDTMAFRDHLLTQYPDQVEIRPQDETGLLDIVGIVAELRGTPDSVIYCCGPEPLPAAIEEACAVHRVRLHVERFAPKANPVDGPCEAFEIELVRTGITLLVPSDLSIIEVLEEAGIDVPSSCEEGICGTCKTTVFSGLPDHHDSVLSAEEHAAGNIIAVCVSRSRSPRLVLDL